MHNSRPVGRLICGQWVHSTQWLRIDLKRGFPPLLHVPVLNGILVLLWGHLHPIIHATTPLFWSPGSEDHWVEPLAWSGRPALTLLTALEDILGCQICGKGACSYLSNCRHSLPLDFQVFIGSESPIKLVDSLVEDGLLGRGWSLCLTYPPLLI